MDDAVDGGEPEAGAGLLRREEGLEDPGADLLGHPAAPVADRERHVGAGGEAEIARRLRELDAGRRDLERPAVRHGVPGVHGEVEQHLRELVRVRHDRPHAGAERRGEGDPLADRARQELLEVRDHLVQGQHLRAEELLARQGEELARDADGPVRRLDDPLEALPRARVAGRELAQEEVGVPEHDREHVGEVVGDPAREAPDRLHLLRLAQALLELVARGLGELALGDVAHRQHPQRPLAAVQRASGDLHGEREPVGAAVARRVGARAVGGRPLWDSGARSSSYRSPRSASRRRP